MPPIQFSQYTPGCIKLDLGGQGVLVVERRPNGAIIEIQGVTELPWDGIVSLELSENDIRYLTDWLAKQ